MEIFYFVFVFLKQKYNLNYTKVLKKKLQYKILKHEAHFIGLKKRKKTVRY